MRSPINQRQPTPGIRALWSWLATLLLLGRVWAGQGDVSPPDLVAVTTDLPEPGVITHYDISLRTDLDQNTLRLQTSCTVRNQSGQALTHVDFDLLAAERSYGASVAIAGVSASNDRTRVPCQFSHAPLAQPSDPDQAGTRQFPKIVRVKLLSPLGPDAECRLHFDYAITIPEPAKDVNYSLITPSPAGGKEVYLLCDYAWIPRMASDTAGRSSLYGRNFFPKGHKSTWRISLAHPAHLESLVLDGRLEGSERSGGTTLSRYSCVAPSAPQIAIGPFERFEVEGSRIAVVFLVPRGKYERQQVENSGRFLQRAFEFYRELFGPLDGKPIHVAVGQAGHIPRGSLDIGHGAFLGMFLNYLPAPGTNAFDEIAAHELAHSWWGDSVSSYGRGTKFLRESLANFAAWHLARTAFQRDRFRGDLALGILQGTLLEPLFRPDADSESDAYVKGPLVLDLLRQEMGDETFFAALRCFASRFRDGHASFPDFVAVCNEVSRRDWLPFLTHWCYGSGLPKYQLVEFNSVGTTNTWRTSVAIRNVGKGMVSCPLELKTTEGAQRERFAVPEGESRAFVWQTTAQVINVVIDPEHTTLQGDAEEGRLKLLALPDVALNGNWPLYWKGVAHGETGDYVRAEALLSRVIAMFKGDMPAIAPHSYYCSRGVVRLRAGQTAQGIDDLRVFLDGILQPEKETPASADKIIRELAYARLLSATTPEEQREQFRKLLRMITGADRAIDPKLTAWRKWWQEHRTSFQPGPEAGQLSPGGMH